MFARRPLLSVALLVLLVSFRTAAHSAPALENYGKIPLGFTENRGQFDPQVAFMTHANGCEIFFTPEGATFLLTRETQASIERRKQNQDKHSALADTAVEREGFAFKQKFVNANRNLTITGEDRLPWNNNYFLGNEPDKWRTDVPNYRAIRIKDVYDGVDMVYYGNQNSIKYDFVVKPKKNPARIALAYDFGNVQAGFSKNGTGELVISTPLGDLKEKKPYCYQVINGQKVEVSAQYKVAGKTTSFELGAYNDEYELIIDPELEYSTYMSYNNTVVNEVIVNDLGEAILTGGTNGGMFVTPGSYSPVWHGNYDVYVTKLNADGSGLVFSTYLGGELHERGLDAAIDTAGNIYVTGYTQGGSFPTTEGAYCRELKGVCDAFVAKLNSTGNTLIYSTLFGEYGWGLSGEDTAYAIAVDTNGNAYIVGETVSALYFQVTPNAYDNTVNGNYDMFLTKFNNTGSGLIYSTLFGGSGHDIPEDMAIDSNGIMYVTGTTRSPNFPISQGAYDQVLNGYSDAFVLRFNPGNNSFSSTFIGGSESTTWEQSYGLALDDSLNIYIIGATKSLDYPVTPGAYNTENINPYYSCSFISKLNPSCSVLMYSTFVNGVSLADIAIDSSRCLYVTGGDLYYLEGFQPTPNAYDQTNNGYQDVILMKFASIHSILEYATYYGDTNSEGGTNIALDNSGGVYLSVRCQLTASYTIYNYAIKFDMTG
ncbi:MAG: DUF7948 domain-containing protein, partial [Candidatus Latescibacterota bacterium]